MSLARALLLGSVTVESGDRSVFCRIFPGGVDFESTSRRCSKKTGNKYIKYGVEFSHIFPFPVVGFVTLGTRRSGRPPLAWVGTGRRGDRWPSLDDQCACDRR